MRCKRCGNKIRFWQRKEPGRNDYHWACAFIITNNGGELK